MNKSTITTIFFSLMTLFGSAQIQTFDKNLKEVQDKAAVVSDNQGYIKFIYPAKEVITGNEGFIQWLGNCTAFHQNTGWELLNITSDDVNNAHYRYRQLWNNIPIYDAYCNAHFYNNKLQIVNGSMKESITVLNQPVLNQEEALNIAIAKSGATEFIWENETEMACLNEISAEAARSIKPVPQLLLYPAGNKNEYIYVWQVELYALKPLAKYQCIINAASGNVLLMNDVLTHALVSGTAVTHYYGLRAISTDSLATSNYILKDYSRGNGIFTYNLNHNTAYSYASNFTDQDNFWNNSSNMDEIATDVHWAAGVSWDYFLDKHGRNGIDGNGYRMISYVHFSNGYAGAFWDGMRAVFGDGNAVYGPMVSVDICAHEYAHGLVQHTAGLLYTGESGALNEGFADIFGTAVEHYALGGQANWTIGEKTGVIIRNIGNPNASGNPDTYLGQYWDVNGEVHQNSTVLSHWFYLLSVGGNGVNDNNQVYAVNGIGIDKAAQIAYRMLNVYLTPSSNYTDARDCAIIAATDLFGNCSPEVIAVTNAMYAVGIGNVFNNNVNVSAAFSADAQNFCINPARVVFQNQSLNAYSYYWDFGDGTFSQASHPEHIYQSAGIYNVKLIAGGGVCGSDTLMHHAFITVDPGQVVVQQMPDHIISEQVYCCHGNLLYVSDTINQNEAVYGKISIAPYGAARIMINLQDIYLTYGKSYIYIYDGPDTYGNLIGCFNGNYLPSQTSFLSEKSSVTIVFQSDKKYISDHFNISWDCTDAVLSPAISAGDALKDSCYNNGYGQSSLIQDHSDETKVNDLFIYPNPAIEKINISGPNIEMLNIFNSAGMLVYSGKVERKTAEYTLSLEGFASGVYRISALHDNTCSYGSFVLRK